MNTPYNNRQTLSMSMSMKLFLKLFIPLMFIGLRCSGLKVFPSFASKVWHPLQFHRGSTALSMAGTLTVVGSGPGDPDLLTIQAYKLLKNASLVVADRLISQEILDLIECELKIANKRPGCAEEAQDELNRWVIEGVESGKNVVRLKIGDPFLFGRGGEEILEYRKHNITALVAPGLSSSYSAPLSANIPITHRDVANQVLICTGFGKFLIMKVIMHYR